MQATERGWIKRFSQTGSGTSRVPHATPTIDGSAQGGDAESCAAVEGPLIRPWSGGSRIQPRHRPAWRWLQIGRRMLRFGEVILGGAEGSGRVLADDTNRASCPRK